MRFFSAIALCLCVASCANIQPYTGSRSYIPVGPGPEDMVLDTLTSNHRLIVSCTERRTDRNGLNGFYAVSLIDGNVGRLAMEGLPDSISLAPHGMDLGPFNGSRVLFVVNHEDQPKRNSILVFRVEADTLAFVVQLVSPLLLSPNDVCTDGAGGLYVSNDRGPGSQLFEKVFELPKSNVVHFDGAQWRVVAEKIRYANGVGVLNNRLFVTGTQERAVLSYPILPDGLLGEPKRWECPKGADNITFSHGKLIVPAHSKFTAFLSHMRNSKKHSPGIVYSVDGVSGDVDTLAIDDGSLMSAISTGLIYRDRLFLSQVFDPFMVSIPVK